MYKYFFWMKVLNMEDSSFVEFGVSSFSNICFKGGHEKLYCCRPSFLFNKDFMSVCNKKNYA